VADPAAAPDPFAALNEPFVQWYGAVEDAAFAALDLALIVRSTPAGGSYTLLRDGTETTEAPVRARFGELRSVTHVPLSVYALAAHPQPDDDERRRRLLSLASTALPVAAAWPEEDERHAATAILTACIDRLEDPTPIRVDGLRRLVAGTKPAVDALVARAGEIQARDCTALLDRWRSEVGDERWARIVAVVGTAPASEGPGTHGLIVHRALGGDAEAEGRLVIIVGLQDDALLRHRLGVVLANRSLAATWFGDAHALESDLMTAPVGDALTRLDQP
jgi:hypothetical protein